MFINTKRHPNISFSSSAGRAQGWKLWGRWFDPSLKHTTNDKLYFKYVLLKSRYSFMNNLSQRARSICIHMSSRILLFTCYHMRLSTLFYATQLCEMFAYEIIMPIINQIIDVVSDTKNIIHNFKYNFLSKAQSIIIVYNFHSFHTQNRFFFFIQNSFKSLRSKNLIKENFFDSIAELFYAANWLEREIAELFGCLFYGKKDSRNLMLQYGDLTVPFQKSSPSIGYRELLFNLILNLIVEIGGSVQL